MTTQKVLGISRVWLEKKATLQALIIVAIFWNVAYGSIVRSVVLFNGGTFEHLGVCWIIAYSLWFGTLSGVIGRLFIRFILASELLKRIAMGLAILSLLILYKWASRDDLKYFDKAVFTLGTSVYLTIVKSSNQSLLDKPIPAESIRILPPNSRLVIKDRFGPVIISSGKGLLRTQAWQNQTFSFDLTPTRRADQMLQYPADGELYPGFEVLQHRKMLRLSYSESVLNLTGLYEFTTLLATYYEGSTLYRDDGLMVHISCLTPDTSSIKVFQILFAGKRPSSLPDSQNAALIIEKQGRHESEWE